MHGRILVTGASGFVGRALVDRMLHDGLPVRATTRRNNFLVEPLLEQAIVPDMSMPFDWQVLLRSIDTVVHCAARVHVMHDIAADPLVEFRRTNVAGTMNLARQASIHRVRRFVFVSSIKVNGESTNLNQPFTADDVAKPVDAYGISKYEAEQSLRALGAETGMEIVIVRPVMVYGPGVKGNFLSMMRWLARGIPVPLGAVNNLRSLVALDNLVGLIVCCVHHPAAANQVFLASDGDDLSTTSLLRQTAHALHKSAWLLPVPVSMLRMAARALGKRAIAQRLLGSLQVDIAKTRDLLGWAPTVTVDEGLRSTATHFLANSASAQLARRAGDGR